MYKPGDELYVYIEGDSYKWAHTRSYRERYAELCIHPCRIIAVHDTWKLDGHTTIYDIGLTDPKGECITRQAYPGMLDMYKEALLKRVLRVVNSMIEQIQPVSVEDVYAFGGFGLGQYPIRVCRGCDKGPCCHEAAPSEYNNQQAPRPCEGKNWYFTIDPAAAARAF